MLPAWSETMWNGTPPSTILVSSLSFHILWTKWLSTLTERTSTPSACSSGYLSATADTSVAQTKVKSPG